MDINDEPTMPWRAEDLTAGQPTIPSGASSTGASAQGKGVSRLRGISRRKLTIGLVGAGVAAATAGIALAEVAQHGGLSSSLGSGLSNIFHGPLAGNAQIGHLLRRAGFGAASPNDLSTYATPGYNGAVDRLINYQSVSDDAMETRLKGLNLDMSKVQDQQQWWMLRMAWTQRPLLEKMTLFWHGYLTSSFHKVGGKNNYSRMMVQNQFLRTHAFDTLDNILLGITADPAMLVYLDLNLSRKGAPNENYARELMELFTLGLGHYTQPDVYNAAAALTGWHVKATDATGQFNPRDHNTLAKTYLGQTGNFDYKDVIRLLTNHPATPWFVSRRMFAFFAHENPSDNDLKPMVDAYSKSNHNIGEVVRAMLLSDQFKSAQAYRGRVKSPTEFVVGAYRALNVQGYEAALPNMVALMGQTLLDPPNVAGWPGDKTSALWLNSGTWMARLNYIDLLLIGSRSATGPYKGVDLQGIINSNHIDSPERFVDHFASYMFDGQLDANRRTQFIDHFKAAGSGKAQITLANGKSYPLGSVRGTLYLMMASPEYQLN